MIAGNRELGQGRTFVHVAAPSAGNGPRLRDGRKGAYGVAPRWLRHPCPHRSDEQCGQDEGDGGEVAEPRDRRCHVTGTERLPSGMPRRVASVQVSGTILVRRVVPAQGPGVRGPACRGLCTDADDVSAAPLQVSADMTAHCKSGACGSSTTRRTNSYLAWV